MPSLRSGIGASWCVLASSRHTSVRMRRLSIRPIRRAGQGTGPQHNQASDTGVGEQARPPFPDWLIEQGLGGRAAGYVHVGGCHMAGKRSHGITQDQARQALHARVDACPRGRPDTKLGVLEVSERGALLRRLRADADVVSGESWAVGGPPRWGRSVEHIGACSGTTAKYSGPGS
jgi:hypothetical protein